jgi:hypothetical protein
VIPLDIASCSAEDIDVHMLPPLVGDVFNAHGWFMVRPIPYQSAGLQAVGLAPQMQELFFTFS